MLPWLEPLSKGENCFWPLGAGRAALPSLCHHTQQRRLHPTARCSLTLPHGSAAALPPLTGSSRGSRHRSTALQGSAAASCVCIYTWQRLEPLLCRDVTHCRTTRTSSRSGKRQPSELCLQAAALSFDSSFDARPEGALPAACFAPCAPHLHASIPHAPQHISVHGKPLQPPCVCVQSGDLTTEVGTPLLWVSCRAFIARRMAACRGLRAGLGASVVYEGSLKFCWLWRFQTS